MLNTILRRLSLTACIGSYFIYNKLKYCQYKVDANDDTNEGEVQDEINAQEDQHNITFTDNGLNDIDDEDADEGNIGPDSKEEDEDDDVEETTEGHVADADQTKDHEGTTLHATSIAGDSQEEGEGYRSPAHTEHASDSHESLSTG